MDIIEKCGGLQNSSMDPLRIHEGVGQLAILVFTYAKKDGTLKKFIREVHVKIRYSDGMKYLGVWPLVGVVPLSHGHYREMWWTPKQKGSVRKGRKERSFGHFHIMSFHFCVCLFKAYVIVCG